MSRLLFIGFLVLCACSDRQTKFATVEELRAFIDNPENGFIHSFESKDLLFETKLTPAISTDSTRHFTIAMRISRNDGGAVLDFGRVGQQEALMREGYLSFEVLKDVSIECDGRLYPALFHHYERNYGLKPSVDVYFEFPEITPNGPVFFVYRDQLFDQGRVQIELNNELFTLCYVEKA